MQKNLTDFYLHIHFGGCLQQREDAAWAAHSPHWSLSLILASISWGSHCVPWNTADDGSSTRETRVEFLALGFGPAQP